MFRIVKILQVSTIKNNVLKTSNHSVFNGTITKGSIVNFIRGFSDKSNDTKVGENIKSHPNKMACKNSPSPCKPSSVPSIKDKPTKSLMDELPQPSGDWKEHDKNRRKTNRRWLLLGVLFASLTVGTLYKIKPMTYKEKKQVEAVQNKKRKIQKHPLSSAEIPKDVPYLLIGGGTASFTAFRAIKSADPKAKVLIVSNEDFFPYMRPPLSKEIWFNDNKESVQNLNFKQWNGSERSLFYEPEDFYINCDKLMEAENGGVAVARGWNVSKLDTDNKFVVLDDGTKINFNKCLIATGSKPNVLPVFENAIKNEKTANMIKIYRDIYDFRESRDLFENAKNIAIVGGGFLGSELACAMARKDQQHEKNIYQIFKEQGNMGKILPEYLSSWTTEKVKKEGVKVLPQSEVVEVKEKNNKLELTLNNGEKLIVDFCVVAVGTSPNTDLAKESGLEVDKEIGGYLVNTELQARSDVYIAGDCACFYDTKLGRRRFEHHDHAVVTGRLAGENMTGARKPYLHQSMFWSDLGPDVGYEAIGIVDSKLPTVGIFAKATPQDNPKAIVTATNEGIRSKTEQLTSDDKEEDKSQLKKSNIQLVNLSEEEDFGKGVIFYLRDDIVVGIVLWNVFNRMGVARQVLADHRKYEDLNEVAKLFTIHEE